MKTDVVEAEHAVNDSGQNMLAGMLLYVGKALVRVDFCVQTGPRGQLLHTFLAVFHKVKQPFGADFHIFHNAVSQRAAVSGLPAALRKEGGTVQNDAQQVVIQCVKFFNFTVKLQRRIAQRVQLCCHKRVSLKKAAGRQPFVFGAIRRRASFWRPQRASAARSCGTALQRS